MPSVFNPRESAECVLTRALKCNSLFQDSCSRSVPRCTNVHSKQTQEVIVIQKYSNNNVTQKDLQQKLYLSFTGLAGLLSNCIGHIYYSETLMADQCAVCRLAGAECEQDELKSRPVPPLPQSGPACSASLQHSPLIGPEPHVSDRAGLSLVQASLSEKAAAAE